MLRVLKDRQNCFVLLDNHTEQKEITPQRTISLKQ